MAANIISSSLMIIPGFVGFSFLNSNQKLLMYFESIKHGVENQSGCRIQTLRSNNGKEYSSGRFQQFCDESRIEH